MGMYKDFKVGTTIKELRKTKGITQLKMSEILDIPYSTYSNYENNNREPTIDVLLKISDVLEISVKDLLDVDKQVSVSSLAKYDVLFKVAIAEQNLQNKEKKLDKQNKNHIDNKNSFDDFLEGFQDYENLKELSDNDLKIIQSLFNNYGYKFYYDYQKSEYVVENNDATSIYISSTELIAFFNDIKSSIKDKIEELFG